MQVSTLIPWYLVKFLANKHKIVFLSIYATYMLICNGANKNATLYNLVYFLFAPTLIYRHNYPRTKKINWRAVISYFLQFIGTIFCMFATIRRFVANNYASSGIEPFNAKTLLSSLLVTGCLGMSLMFLGWYGLLQCWLNGWAEMLRFADRMFYDEWWTSSQFSKYFRKWNLVVSDWLHTYLYQPINDVRIC
ncbi:Sterol O-acyltransferase 1-like protein [Dinothrombium tinctorium]|uniref:Sterol O-acyltransferase 1-like protein n=1 Tax=Dinothrombium tinctorium TaxID=1965070 RepID=A0A443QUH7_9ACAR|nr:Sterol O-acyltransferase 1-like protein [Dinothrombium tinctorium]